MSHTEQEVCNSLLLLNLLTRKWKGVHGIIYFSESFACHEKGVYDLHLHMADLPVKICSVLKTSFRNGIFMRYDDACPILHIFVRLYKLLILILIFATLSYIAQKLRLPPSKHIYITFPLVQRGINVELWKCDRTCY